MADMNTKEIVPGGPSREEARELNQPKPRSKSKTGGRLMNSAAVGTAAFLGGTLAEQVHQAVNNPPPPRVQEAPEQDPLNRKPPEGVVFPENTRADEPFDSAQGGPVLTKRIFIPLVNKEYRQLWPAEFGAPERGVTLFNRGIQKGVKIGDQQLFENLLYLRQKYGRPDLKLEIYFYDSVVQMNLSGVSASLQRERIPYSFWAKNIRILDEEGNFLYIKSYPDTTKDGIIRFDVRRDTILRIHASLPELLPGVTLDGFQMGEIEAGMSNEIIEDVILLNGDGQPSVPIIYPDTEVARDFSTHQAVIRSQNGRPRTTVIKLVIR